MLSRGSDAGNCHANGKLVDMSGNHKSERIPHLMSTFSVPAMILGTGDSVVKTDLGSADTAPRF